MIRLLAYLRGDFTAYQRHTRQAVLPHFLLLSLLACTAFAYIWHFKAELLRMLEFVHDAPQGIAQGYLQLHIASITYIVAGAALTLALNRFYLLYLGVGFVTVGFSQIRGLLARLTVDHSTHSFIEHLEYGYVANVANAGLAIRLMYLGYALYLYAFVAKHQKPARRSENI